MKKLIYTILFIMLGLVLIGCKAKTVYVPVESVKTEYRDRLERDSIYVRDSIVITKNGDTIHIFQYKYIYKDKLIRDTINKTDSIAVPFPVVEIKEVNRLHTWQIVLMCLGGVLIGFIGYRLYRFIRK